MMLLQKSREPLCKPTAKFNPRKLLVKGAIWIITYNKSSYSII